MVQIYNAFNLIFSTKIKAHTSQLGNFILECEYNDQIHYLSGN